MSAKHTFAISPEVMAILNRCTITEETIVLPAGEQLSRPLYEAVNKVFAAYGGVWKGGKSKFHKFPAGGTAKIKEAISGGEVKREKVIRQAFYTPDVAADELVAFALINVDKPRILEPSCGNGQIIRAIRKACPGSLISAYEIDEVEAEYARKNCPHGYHDTSIETKDFLSVGPAPEFDFVIMNPPFQRGQDKAHIQHALKFLIPGGTLVSIVPENFTGILFDDSYLLPDGSFRESGTSISLKIIRVRV